MLNVNYTYIISWLDKDSKFGYHVILRISQKKKTCYSKYLFFCISKLIKCNLLLLTKLLKSLHVNQN